MLVVPAIAIATDPFGGRQDRGILYRRVVTFADGADPGVLAGNVVKSGRNETHMRLGRPAAASHRAFVNWSRCRCHN